MLSNPQKFRLKRAQAEAALDDIEYRDAIEQTTALPGCRSSTDPRLTDRHMDVLLAYFEAIFWQKFDRGQVGVSDARGATFRQRGYWAAKNTAASTSRDRYVAGELTCQIAAVERELNELGYGLAYLRAIQNKIVPFRATAYLAALKRTLVSKQKKTADLPF